MVELWMVTFLFGFLMGFLAVPVVAKIVEWKHKRDWERAGERWAQTFKRATKASEFFGELPPSDSMVEDIRERVRESNTLPEHERKEHEARIEEIEKKAKEVGHRVNENGCRNLDPENCDHDYLEVHPSGGDPSSPTGKRCRKCNNQVWY